MCVGLSACCCVSNKNQVQSQSQLHGTLVEPQIRSKHKADTNYIYIKELGLKYIHNQLTYTPLYSASLSARYSRNWSYSQNVSFIANCIKYIYIFTFLGNILLFSD